MSSEQLIGLQVSFCSEPLNRLDLALEMLVLLHRDFQGIGEVSFADSDYAGCGFIRLG